jgi:hypothetical protein
MLELPVVSSLTEALNATEAAPAVGLGVMLRPEVTGPVVSAGAETVMLILAEAASHPLV